MTWSARSRSVGGIVMPRALAILRLMTSPSAIAAAVESETIDMIRRSIVLLVLATMVAVAACASMSGHPHREIFDDVPAKVDPGARYLFHMHGYVVERLGPAGAASVESYFWRWTVEALADREFVVISEARSRDTYVEAYALTVARQVA